MNILALQLKRIGDAVLTAPALAAVRARFPDAWISLVLEGAAADLAPGFTSVDEVLVSASGGQAIALGAEVVVVGLAIVIALIVARTIAAALARRRETALVPAEGGGAR